MPASFRRLLPALLLFGLIPPTVVRADGPPDKLYRPACGPKDVETRTDWYGVYLGKTKIGYVKMARDRLPDGAIRETQEMRMKLVSFGQKAELSNTQTTVFAAQAPYPLLRGELLQDDGKVKQRTTVTKSKEGYEAVHEASGEVRKKLLKEIDYCLADALAGDLWIRSGPKAGARISVRHFDLMDQKMDTQDSKLLAVQESIAKGVKVRTYTVETASRAKKIKAVSRHDQTGLLLSDQVAVFELRLESEQQAKDTRYSADLFVMGMVKIDRKLGETKDVTELVLEVRSKAGNEGEAFVDGPRQSVTAAAKGGRVLRLGKAHGKRVKVSAKVAKENLAETPNYPITHAKVRELAAKAVGDAKEPRAKVKRLVKFVHDYIEPSLSANLPQVHDLIAHKKGDCKSYALLFTNLARAAGVPAREVSGLLYCGDDFKAFGGHAWNEVLLDDEWVPIDASLGETEVDATHISFGAEHEATSALLNTLGKLSFRVLEVKTR